MLRPPSVLGHSLGQPVRLSGALGEVRILGALVAGEARPDRTHIGSFSQLSQSGERRQLTGKPPLLPHVYREQLRAERAAMRSTAISPPALVS